MKNDLMPTNDIHINDIHDGNVAIVQPEHDMIGDGVAGDKHAFSGDRNINILGNLTVSATVAMCEAFILGNDVGATRIYFR